jgi:hypothetical protein
VPKFTLLIETNCAPGTDEEFNRWYDEVHIPELLTIDGFVSATRFEVADAQMGRSLPPQRYMALYEIDADSAQQALDALAAKTRELHMSDTLQTGPGAMKARMYASLAT